MATKQNIIIDQGTSFVTSLTITDDAGDVIDLTDYSVSGQIRKWYSSNSISASFTTEVPTPNNGIVFLSLTANTTANIEAGRYVYDVKATDGDGLVSRTVEGIVTVTPQVTRS